MTPISPRALAARRVPLKLARVIIALASSLVMAAGIAINSLHWSGIDPGFEFDAFAVAGLAVALLVVFSGTFARSRRLRIGAFVLALVGASIVGSGTWLGRAAIAAIMTVTCIGIPWAWSNFRSRPRQPSPSMPIPVRATAVASLILMLAMMGAVLVHQPTALAAIFQTQPVASCDAATISVSHNGEPLDLAIDDITIDLSEAAETFSFQATTTRPANVRVEFDAIEPWVVTDDVVLWAETIQANESSNYVAKIGRDGPFGVYQLRLGESSGRLGRGPVPVVPGRSSLTAVFTFLDGSTPQVCRIEIEIQLRAQPYTTLPGLLSLTATGLVCTSLSPTRSTAGGLSSSPFEFASLDIDGHPITCNAVRPTANVTANSDSSFELTLKARLTENEEKMSDPDLATSGVATNQLLTLVSVRGAVAVGSGLTEVTISGRIRTGPQTGQTTLTLAFDYLSETENVDLQFFIDEEKPVIELRERPIKQATPTPTQQLEEAENATQR